MSALDKIMDKANGNKVTNLEGCIIVTKQANWDNMAASAAAELAALQAENERLRETLEQARIDFAKMDKYFTANCFNFQYEKMQSYMYFLRNSLLG